MTPHRPTHLSRRPRQTLQFGVEEREIESCVVDDQLSAAQEFQQLLDHVRKARLLRQKLIRDAVHLQRASIDFAIRAQIAMKGASGLAPIQQLDAADLNDAMTLLGFETGGFSVEDDLAHEREAVIGLSVLRLSCLTQPSAFSRIAPGSNLPSSPRV